MGRGQELHQLPNPDNVPAGVTTGYQRQNNNIFAIQTGLCTMEPHDNGDSITIPYGGVIEFNGVMYALGQTVTLPKPNPSVAYWVAVASSENNPDYATFLLVTRPGRWVPAKQGSYNLRGQRTIDWVSMGELAPPRPTGTAFSQSVKGTANIRLQKGWYYVELRSGRGGGDGERINGGKADQELQHNIIVFSRGETHRIKVGGSGEPGQSGGRGLTPLTFWMLPDIGHGGGGGGGGGEESYFDCHSTGAVQGGYGADGNSAQRASGGRGGSVGQSGRSPAVFPTGVIAINSPTGNVGIGGNSPGFRSGGGGGGGGIHIEDQGYGSMFIVGGGNGGDGGRDGALQPDGSPGGFCGVYLLGE